MNDQPVGTILMNIDARLARIEQNLPRLATREEMHAEIQAAIAPLTTHADTDGLRQQLMVLFEDLRDDNRIILEHLVAVSARVGELGRR
jgi:hypothetical protein